MTLEQARLSDKVRAIEEARIQANTAQMLIASLPTILLDLSRQEQEKLIIALISRIDVDRNNAVSITLRLDPSVIHSLGLPNPPQASSPQPESEPSGDSLSAESGSSTSAALDSTPAKVTGLIVNTIKL